MKDHFQIRLSENVSIFASHVAHVSFDKYGIFPFDCWKVKVIFVAGGLSYRQHLTCKDKNDAIQTALSVERRAKEFMEIAVQNQHNETESEETEEAE